MTLPSQPTPLTEEQKREFCLMASVGCDREMASKYLGCTFSQLRYELKQDAQFAQQLRRAEATPEFHHMRNLHNAAKDEKHWRASVWWLERCAPDRYGRRAPDAISTSQLQEIMEELADVIVAEITSPNDRQRLLAKISQMAQKIQCDTSDDKTIASESLPDEADGECHNS